MDEYPRLTDRAKALAVELLRIGRKARITLVLAASEATADALGATIAETVAVKILLPCRHTDIRLVLGQGMGAKGWRPDRLHPESGESSEDAGKVYIYAAGSREPVISKIRKLERERAWENGTHRAAHGLPTIDRDTLDTARTRRPTITGTRASDAVPLAVDRQAVVDVIRVFDGHLKLWTEDILTHLSTIDERYQGWNEKTLAAVLRPLGIAPGQVRIGDRNRNGYHLDTITDAWHTHRLTGGRHD